MTLTLINVSFPVTGGDVYVDVLVYNVYVLCILSLNSDIAILNSVYRYYYLHVRNVQCWSLSKIITNVTFNRDIN